MNDGWDQCRRYWNTGHIDESTDCIGDIHGRYVVRGIVKYCPICDNRLVQGRCMDCGGIEVEDGEEAKLQGSSDTE